MRHALLLLHCMLCLLVCRHCCCCCVAQQLQVSCGLMCAACITEQYNRRQTRSWVIMAAAKGSQRWSEDAFFHNAATRASPSVPAHTADTLYPSTARSCQTVCSTVRTCCTIDAASEGWQLAMQWRDTAQQGGYAGGGPLVLQRTQQPQQITWYKKALSCLLELCSTMHVDLIQFAMPCTARCSITQINVDCSNIHESSLIIRHVQYSALWCVCSPQLHLLLLMDGTHLQAAGLPAVLDQLWWCLCVLTSLFKGSRARYCPITCVCST